MKYLGVDYGSRKVGLAIGNDVLAEPLLVIRYIDIESLLQKIKIIIEKEKIDKIIVGVAENEIAIEQKEFAGKLNAETYDETLSTQDAISLSIQSGIKRKKRKSMEDAYAATIMLQNYLDSHDKINLK